MPEITNSETKQSVIKLLKEEFNKWNKVLSSLDDTKAETVLYSNRRVKDEVAHLWAWQKLSVARLSAAISNSNPDFSEIINTPFIPEDEDKWDHFNESIYNQFKNKSWSSIYSEWKQNFEVFISQAEKISEASYLEKSKFAWMHGEALIEVLKGSLHHHQDHWLNLVIKGAFKGV